MNLIRVCGLCIFAKNVLNTMGKLCGSFMALAILMLLPTCSGKYSDAIVGDWSFSFVTRHSDMTKDNCTVNWTFCKGGDNPRFVETRVYDVEYNGEDGADIHCRSTSYVEGTYDIVFGNLMLDYDVSTLSVKAASNGVTISGGRRNDGYEILQFEYDKNELADDAKSDVYRYLFTAYQEFNDAGLISISDITDRTFVLEDDDLGTITAYRQ